MKPSPLCCLQGEEISKQKQFSNAMTLHAARQRHSSVFATSVALIAIRALNTRLCSIGSLRIARLDFWYRKQYYFFVQR